MCLVVQLCDIAVAEIVDVVKLIMTDPRMKHLLHEVFMPQSFAPASGGAARGNDTQMVDSEPGALAPSAADGSLPAADAAPPADVSAAPDGALPMPVAAAASSSGVGDELRLARALPPNCFAVPCKNYSMYGKNMRDVYLARFSVKSDAVIRFRSRDSKVIVPDLLVATGKYSRIDNAQNAIVKLMDRNDAKMQDLDSIEVDKSLTNMVSAYCSNQKFCMHF